MKRAVEIDIDKDETENPRVKAAIYLSCIAGVCSLLVLILVSKIFVIYYTCLWFSFYISIDI